MGILIAVMNLFYAIERSDHFHFPSNSYTNHWMDGEQLIEYAWQASSRVNYARWMGILNYKENSKSNVWR